MTTVACPHGKEMELSRIFEAIEALINTRSPSAGNTEEEALRCRLEENLGSFKAQLGHSKPDDELSIHLEKNRRPAVSRGLPENLVLYNGFTVEGLSLLAVLDNHTRILHKEDVMVTARPGHAPPASRALLSVNDSKLLHSLLEFVVCLGVYPYLLPGMDTLLKARLKHAHCVTKGTDLPSSTLNEMLWTCLSVLVECCRNPVIGPAVISKHLTDILAALMQVCYAPQSKQVKSEEAVSVTQATSSRPVKEVCLEMLQGLAKRTYQPLFVQEILRLKAASGRGQPKGKASSGRGKPKGVTSSRGGGGGMQWLGRACEVVLLERLLSKNGVQHVISGMIPPGQSSEEQVDWRLCQAIAQMLMCCFSRATSLREYYALASPQLLHLLSKGSPKDPHFRVAVETISLMVAKNSEVAEAHLLGPLTQPLTAFIQGETSDPERDDLESGDPEGGVKELEDCIHVLHKICIAVEASSVLLTSLLPYTPLLFHISSMPSHLNKISERAEEILLCVLKAAQKSDVLRFFCVVCGIHHNADGGAISFKTLNPSQQAPPSALHKMRPAQQPPSSTLHELDPSQQAPPSQSLDSMENTCQHVVRLLKSDVFSTGGLVGHFFIKCLDHLSLVLDTSSNFSPQTPLDTIKSENSSRETSSVLLECEDALPLSSSQVEEGTRVLYMTSALCEQLSERVLEEADLPSLVVACSAVLRCHAKCLERGENVAIRVSDSVEGCYGDRMLGGRISLDLVLGLLTGVLVGPRKVDSTCRDELASMQSALSVISTHFPDAEVRSMADGLLTCILTLGAVWSQDMHQSKHKANEKTKKATTSSYQTVLQDLKDPLIPMKGHALVVLTRLINIKDRETVENAASLLHMLKESLCHADSYVYLAAINALVALALVSPANTAETVLTTLCQEYASLHGRPDPTARSKYDQVTGQLRSRQLREQTLVEEAGQSEFPARGETAKTTGKRENVETRMKLGEALVRVFMELPEMLSHYLEDILASLLTAAKDPEPLLRASSLSGIAQVCSVGKVVLTSLITEVISCVDHILIGEREVKVRQAALLVLKRIVEASKSVSVEERSGWLLEVYRMLKRVDSYEEDELTRTHAHAALGELDSLMKTFLFSPSQVKMEKKITILSSS